MPLSAPIELTAKPDDGAVMNAIGRVVSRTRARHAIVGTTVFLLLVAAGIVSRQTALGVGLGIVVGGTALWRGPGSGPPPLRRGELRGLFQEVETW